VNRFLEEENYFYDAASSYQRTLLTWDYHKEAWLNFDEAREAWFNKGEEAFRLQLERVEQLLAGAQTRLQEAR